MEEGLPTCLLADLLPQVRGKLVHQGYGYCLLYLQIYFDVLKALFSVKNKVFSVPHVNICLFLNKVGDLDHRLCGSIDLI